MAGIESLFYREYGVLSAILSGSAVAFDKRLILKVISMGKRLQIVAAFAGIGFILPWVVVVFYAIAHRLGGNPSTKPLLCLCPSSIISLGLDNASLLVGLFGWLLISVSSAILYSIPGAVVSLFVGWWKSA